MAQHPRYLGWQVDWPVFVKYPFSADMKDWKRGEPFNWFERNMKPEKVAQLYLAGFLYHNEDLIIQNKVGDRLSEMNSAQLARLVNLLNEVVKDRTTTATEFNNKRCKQSKVDDKQRGIIRRFLINNKWIEEDFYRIRDIVLNEV